jgi:hypothetical protein
VTGHEGRSATPQLEGPAGTPEFEPNDQAERSFALNRHLRDLATGIAFLCFNAFYYLSSFDIVIFAGASASPITARTLPVFWALLMALLAGILIVRSLLRMRAEKAAGGETVRFRAGAAAHWLRDNLSVVGTFAALFFYAACLRNAGYLLCTSVYLVAQILLLTERKKLTKKVVIFSCVLSLLFTLASYWVFSKILMVPLPRGILYF